MMTRIPDKETTVITTERAAVKSTLFNKIIGDAGTVFRNMIKRKFEKFVKRDSESKQLVDGLTYKEFALL
jgi:hypothetical protein